MRGVRFHFKIISPFANPDVHLSRRGKTFQQTMTFSVSIQNILRALACISRGQGGERYRPTPLVSRRKKIVWEHVYIFVCSCRLWAIVISIISSIIFCFSVRNRSGGAHFYLCPSVKYCTLVHFFQGKTKTLYAYSPVQIHGKVARKTCIFRVFQHFSLCHLGKSDNYSIRLNEGILKPTAVQTIYVESHIFSKKGQCDLQRKWRKQDWGCRGKQERKREK